MCMARPLRDVKAIYGYVPYGEIMRPSQTQDKFIVRLPDGMREQISEAAAANNRSMTAEIVARLARSFEGGAFNAGGTGADAGDQVTQDAISTLERRMRELENAMANLINNDRSYDHEMRITRLESRS